MIDETLFKTDYLGKDGFVWWLGQVAPRDVWKSQSYHSNFADPKLADTNWPERCKVRIIGYHSFRKGELEDKELPWAHVMMDPALGSAQGGDGMTHNLTGGEVCFGFFLDGDDAQQPVVVGLIHRHRMVQNFPPDDDFAFRPFTGHPGNIPSTKREVGNQTQPKEAPSPITPSIAAANPGIGFTDGNFTVPVDVAFNSNLNLGIGTLPFSINYGDRFVNLSDNAAYLAFIKKTTFTYVPPSACNDNFIGQITQALQDFIAFTNGITKYAEVYIDPVLNTVVDIGSEIKSAARSIAGIIRLIINSIRGGLIKCVIALFKKFIGWTNDPTQTIISQSVKNILNILFCIFEKMMPSIIEFIEGLLYKMVDSVYNAPTCAIEQWVSGILTKVMDTIENSLDSIISGISWLTGGLSNVFSVLNQASSLASRIYSFIGCDNLKCKTPSKWSSNFGPSEMEADNWEKTVGQINVFKGVSDGLGSVEGAIAGLSLYGQNLIYDACNVLVNDPKTQDDLGPLPPGSKWKNCIPPKVNVYGDGIGAKLIPIVGINSSIISIEIASRGIGYTHPPVLSIIDKSGYGKGAKAQATIDSNGRISKVLILKGGRGYCKGNYPDSEVYLRSTKSSVYEGESFDIIVSVSNISDYSEIKYKITGVKSTEIKQDLEGTLIIKDKKATITIDTLINNIKDYKEFVFTLPDYEKSTSVLIRDVSDSILDKSYKLTASSYQINEGNQFSVTLKTKNVEDNTIVPFKISGISTGLIDNQNSYTNFTVIDNKSTIKFETKKGVINSNQIFKLDLENKKDSVAVLIKLVTSPGIRTDPDVCIKELVVIRPGIGYTLGDKATDGVNTYDLIISPINGSIVAAKPISSPICGFTDNPRIDINTNTGNGAEILPVVTLNKNLPNNGTGIGISVINVVDCI